MVRDVNTTEIFWDLLFGSDLPGVWGFFAVCFNRYTEIKYLCFIYIDTICKKKPHA